MSILSELPRTKPKPFYAALGHRPYWQYTIGGYSGIESWSAKVLLVTDAVTEPTVVTASRKAHIGRSDFEVIAIPAHADLTRELAMSIVGLGGSACATVRHLSSRGGMITPGAEAALVSSNGSIEWKSGYLHDALHAVPRPRAASHDTGGAQLDLVHEVTQLAGLA